MKYVYPVFITALIMMGIALYLSERKLEATQAELAVAEEINKINLKSIEQLERTIKTTDKIMAQWDEDRTTIAQIRNETRKAIKEAMKDEVFKVWANTPVPAGAWSVLQQAVNQ